MPYVDEEEFPGYEMVLNFGDFDHSWSEMRVYRKDRRFFYLTDSGCSCYGWNDDNKMSEQDMIELSTMESARQAYLQFAESPYTHVDLKWFDVQPKLHELGLR